MIVLSAVSWIFNLNWVQFHVVLIRYRVEVGDSAFLFSKGTRWNCTYNFRFGVNETKSFKFLFLFVNHLEHHIKYQRLYWRVQFHSVPLRNYECNFTLKTKNAKKLRPDLYCVNAVPPDSSLNFCVQFHLVCLFNNVITLLQCY